ncbi:DUF6207 family protein [Streptomyces mutabilis]|uniref:DUF6207 family protein n=1 Tax=Streptomyces mutabilis TaxID=67332 RepID=UPI0022BA3A3D|nr:DUF6207 family protein [Streptomyces mutabilis]MCZ9351014.1 DUF6207 family protein [Streptomyces mutabilis]
MNPINEAHVAEPGLAVVEVAAADDETAFGVQELLATRWAIAAAVFPGPAAAARLKDVKWIWGGVDAAGADAEHSRPQH